MQILLSGPDFHEYNDFVAHGLEALGQNVIVSKWPDLWESFTDRARLYFAQNFFEEFRFQEYVLDVIDDKISAYNEKLLTLIRENHPDIFLVLNGKILLPETINEANKYTTTALWCYDKATAFPAVLNAANQYDLFYVFEASDVEDLADRGINVTYLPLGYSPDKYHPIEDGNHAEKPIDVCFVGTLTQKRRRLFDHIIDAFPQLNIQIWGDNWSFYNPLGWIEYRLRRRHLGNRLNNYNISAKEANEIYNKCKICVNIQGHHNQESMNARTFEIPGSGGFQLVDFKPRLSDELSPEKEVATYTNSNELVEKIEYYMNNPDERREIAMRGHKKAIERFRYQDRVNQIIKDYNSLMN